MALDVVLFPKPLVQFLDNGEDVIQGNNSWEALPALLEEVKKINQYELERFNSSKTSLEASPKIEPVVREIENEFNNNELILSNLESAIGQEDFEAFSSGLEALEESSYKLALLSLVINKHFTAEKPMSPISVINDTLRIGFMVNQESISPDTLKDQLAPLYNLQSSFKLELPFIRLKLGEDNDMLKGLQAGISALEQAIGGLYLYLFETEDKIDLEVALKFLKVSGDTLVFWATQLNNNLPDSYKNLEERYREYFELLLTDYLKEKEENKEKTGNYNESAKEYIKFLIDMEENRLKNITEDRENIFLTCEEKEEAFKKLEEMTQNQLQILNNLLSLDIEQMSPVYQEYRNATREKNAFWTETLAKTLPPQELNKAENLLSLFNMIKAVYNGTFHKKRFNEQLKEFYNRQKDLFVTLEKRREHALEEKEEANSLLQSLEKQMEGIEKCWEFFDTQEKDLLVEGSRLIADATLQLVRLQNNITEKEEQEGKLICLCGAFNSKDEDKCYNCGFELPGTGGKVIFDIKEDEENYLPEDRITGENLKPLEEALTALEKGEIDNKEAEEVFREFLRRVEFVESQLELKVKAIVDTVKDQKLTENQTKFLSIIANFKQALDNILTNFDEKSVYSLKEELNKLKETNTELFALKDELEALATSSATS